MPRPAPAASTGGTGIGCGGGVLRDRRRRIDLRQHAAGPRAGGGSRSRGSAANGGGGSAAAHGAEDGPGIGLIGRRSGRRSDRSGRAEQHRSGNQNADRSATTRDSHMPSPGAAGVCPRKKNVKRIVQIGVAFHRSERKFLIRGYNSRFVTGRRLGLARADSPVSRAAMSAAPRPAAPRMGAARSGVDRISERSRAVARRPEAGRARSRGLRRGGPRRRQGREGVAGRGARGRRRKRARARARSPR